MAWVGTGTKELNAALMFGDCDLSFFLFFLFTFFYSHCFRFSVRGGSPIEKKEAHESWTPRRQEIRNPFINITSLNNFGQYFLFDSEQQKWFIGGRDYGVLGVSFGW